MKIIEIANYILMTAFFVCSSYQFIYILVLLFNKKKEHEKTVLHQFAILISARNEENVIANLIKSVKSQNYPKSMVSVFVVADNCTDATAAVARKAGAVVYERFNRSQVGKGYALEFLIDRIFHEFKKDKFDAFIIFDADNILDKNYITEMNRTFSDGYKIITSYRNSKNYADNWISAGYSLWFMHESEHLNHARMLCGTSCTVSGTGFLFSREIIEKTNGWKCFLLSEDTEFTVHHVLDGEKIGYCHAAVFFDEQPTKFVVSCKQRMRWVRGYMQVLEKYGLKLLRGIFTKHSFSCFDITMVNIPVMLLTAISIIINTAAFVISWYNRDITSMKIAFNAIIGTYLALFYMGVFTTITEWKQIHCQTYKKILYTFSFPIFVLSYVPVVLATLCSKVEWTPVAHSVNVSAKDIVKSKVKNTQI